MDMTGVEFTESMERLICDGKIVGYERKHLWSSVFDKNSLEIIIEHSVRIAGLWTEVAPDQEEDNKDCIRYTSANKGIKVGDEWFFTGDVFKRHGKRCTLKHDDYGGFYLEDKDNKYTWRPFEDSLKIGAVYDRG